MPKSAETSVIGDVIDDIDNRSAVDKTQPVFVKSFQRVVAYDHETWDRLSTLFYYITDLKIN